MQIARRAQQAVVNLRLLINAGSAGVAVLHPLCAPAAEARSQPAKIIKESGPVVTRTPDGYAAAVAAGARLLLPAAYCGIIRRRRGTHAPLGPRSCHQSY